MLNPTVGRWMEEDPDGFAAGNADLYGYVSNDPMNFVDPSGLAHITPSQSNVINAGSLAGPLTPDEYGVSEPLPTEGQTPLKIVKGDKIALNKNTFPFKDGEVKGDGAITVTKDATIEMLTGPNKGRQFSGWFVISATTDFRMDKQWHWIQIAVNTITKSDDTLSTEYIRTVLRGGRPAWRIPSQPYLDTVSPNFEDPNSSYYDKVNTASIVTPTELAIVDSPNPGPLSPKLYKKSVFTFDAYLVHGTKFYYHLRWKATFTHDGTRWKPQYELLPGSGPTNAVPDWTTKPRLPGGYLKVDMGGKASMPFDYINPFSKKKEQ